MLYFVALGPMEVRNDFCTVTIKGLLQQKLLATFLASGEKLLTADALTEELWGARPPSRTENALHAQICRLRRTLTALEPRREESRIVRASSGYLLSMGGAEFDGAILRDTVRMVQMKDGRHTRQDAETLRAVLDLWHGPTFGGISGGPICQKSVVNYREYYTAAQALLFELEMNLGGCAKVVPELSALVEEYPFQESFCRLLMMALYHSGRQADALTVARDLRTRLMDEMGIDPEPTLRILEKAILNHDHKLLEEAALLSRARTAGGGHPHATSAAADPPGIGRQVRSWAADLPGRRQLVPAVTRARR